jgi:hypothetical protein
MGLAIHFSLALPETRDPAVAATQLARLRLAAERYPFHLITPIWRFRNAECGAGNGSPLREPRDRLRTAARYRATLPGTDCQLELEPREILGFVIRVGRRCESLPLGLARYPLLAPYGGEPYPTGLPGWHWRATCVTQYASLCGFEYFLRCHQAVIAVLDQARALGFGVTVEDEGGYWTHRDVSRLLEAVERAHRRSSPLRAVSAPSS